MKGYFVTISLIGLYALLLLLAFSASEYLNNSDQALFHGYASAKLAQAKTDASQSLSILYGTTVRSVSNGTYENVTIIQVAPKSSGLIANYSQFLSGEASGLAGIKMDMAMQGGRADSFSSTGLEYDYDLVCHAGIHGIGGASNISAYRLEISSTEKLNETVLPPFSPSGDMFIEATIHDADGIRNVSGNISSSTAGNLVFRNSVDTSKILNITMGAINGSSGSIGISCSGTQAAWNITFALPAQNSPSKWMFKDRLKASVLDRGIDTYIDVASAKDAG